MPDKLGSLFAHFSLTSAWIILLLGPAGMECRYPCLNDGEPVLLGQNGNEFRCECLAGFFGPFCEYQDTSQTSADTKDRGSPLFPHSVSSSSSNSSSQRGGWEATFVNLLLCIFFLLLLPSLVVYAVRALYLFLKRCHSHYGQQQERAVAASNIHHQQHNHPTPPPQYWAAMAEEGNSSNTTIRASQIWHGTNTRLWPVPSQEQHRRRRRRSASPVTEVTVQLPASICRPLHGTRSAGPLASSQLHQTQSLTLNEFHELLLNIQREMLAQQQMEREQRHQGTETATTICSLPVPNSPTLAPPPPPLEPPPNYELALSSTCPL